MSTITKLSQDVTQYYNNITSPIWRKCENTKRYTIINSAKGGSESQIENSRAEQGAWKDGPSDGQLMIYALLRISDQQLRESTSSKL